ncbi:MAG TPA: type 4a pilus biogenesis protein PilO [Candidatus Omnitrophota bacterium]|nr:type 4a pilus biogenesis protein PilO [Candidatus Omnitrophota bacterium]HPD84005.1 type 4a pilus biogenesis protein PilO [Candidatus Omnitrophota bacterium]HRZ02862.1 type 4a pilus biogenesis protein PilO [Candidatus Omnitrophota bacterium]
MIKRPQKASEPTDVFINLAVKYSPLWLPGVLFVALTMFFIWPSFRTLLTLSRDIQEKENIVTSVTRNSADFSRTKAQIRDLLKKATELEGKMPTRTNTNLIFDTLQEITKRSKLKFSSLDPLPIKKHTLEQTNDLFIELPVRVRLNCGYYDLIDFLGKIETADQLMKITDLSIKDDPGQEWDHAIELSISAFSREKAND